MPGKLLYICKFNPYTHFGGSALRNRSIIQLLESEYDVSLACFSTNETDFTNTPGNIHCLKCECSWVKGGLREKTLSIAKFYSEEMAELVGQLTSADDYVVIYVSELVMFQYVKYCANWQRSKVILDCHNVESALLQEGVGYQSAVRKLIFGTEYRLLSRFERRAMKCSSLLVLVSEEDRMRVNNNYGIREKIIVVPTCLPQTSTQPSETEANEPETAPQNRFAIVGTLDWHANRISIEWFLREIWEPFAEQNEDAKLFLIGKKNQDEKEFDGSSVSCFYNVKDVGEVLCRADVAVAPILYGGGSRVKILEYFYHGKPVIATRKGAEGLGLIPDVHYLLAENYSDFQIAVEKLLDMTFRQRLVNNGYNLLKSRYNIELYKERLLGAIENC